MQGSYRIGRIFGIPIRIHFSFLIVIPLLAWIIGSQISLTTDTIRGLFQVPINPSLITAGFMPWILGTVVALGLFLGVLVHEIAHCIVARKNGVKIQSITLLLFGGVSQMEEEGVPDPKVELPMALVGPLTSLLFGIACAGLVYLVPDMTPYPPVAGVLVFIFGYLAVLNVILFAFNLVPAFPMDGGRVLRAALAKRMPIHRATRIAADVGKAFAIIFGIVGILFFNPFLILIALFVYLGASGEATMDQFTYLLHDVTVGTTMSSPVTVVTPAMTIAKVMEMMLATKHLGFPVVEEDKTVGMITLVDVNRVPQTDREAKQVRDIMTRNPITLPPSAPVMDALKIMSARNIGRIPIVQGGRIVGIVTRSDILKVAEIKKV
ncbi:CBS domain-containing protein [Methanoregula sp.]|uniref:CBS domain-containing protein n=1 Tax=Methanoregula sp. TaxID=2052170 RepID=UPI003BB1A33C